MVMKSSAWILFAGMVLQGCSSSLTVDPDTAEVTPKSIRYEKLNRRLHGQEAKLLLLDGKQIVGMPVSVGYDTIRIQERTDGALRSIPTRQIIEIEQTDRLRGTIEGVAFGGLIGGAAGLGLAGAFVHSAGEGGPGILLVVIGSACVGATAGIVAGIVKGHTITYKLAAPMPLRNTDRDAKATNLPQGFGLESLPSDKEVGYVQEWMDRE
jgi:hypothetical protein